MSALKCRGDSGIEKVWGVCPGTNYLKVFWFNEDLRFFFEVKCNRSRTTVKTMLQEKILIQLCKSIIKIVTLFDYRGINLYLFYTVDITVCKTV